MLIKNSSYHTKYYDLKKKVYINPSKERWANFKIDNAALDTHITNSQAYSQRPDSYVNVIGSILPIPARSTWKRQGDLLIEFEQKILDNSSSLGIEDLMRYLNKLKNIISGRVAVELSGGLDTAIIIGIARHLGVKIKLIGGISDRYEFRTERFVQELIAKDFDDVTFIPESSALPFSNLSNTPFHAMPNKSSLFHYVHSVTADWANENEIKYILNGIGFDSLLIDKVQKKSTSLIFDKINLDDSWPNDYVFKTKSTSYINIISNDYIRKIIITMRASEPNDNQKKWARKIFADYIPNELSKYRYKASFAANYAEGLNSNKDEIMEICEKAYNHCKLPKIEPKIMKKLLKGLEEFDQKSEFEFITRLSFANWMHSFLK